MQNPYNSKAGAPNASSIDATARSDPSIPVPAARYMVCSCTCSFYLGLLSRERADDKPSLLATAIRVLPSHHPKRGLYSNPAASCGRVRQMQQVRPCSSLGCRLHEEQEIVLQSVRQMVAACQAGNARCYCVVLRRKLTGASGITMHKQQGPNGTAPLAIVGS